MIPPYSASKTFKETPPRNPNTDPITAVTTSVAPIFHPIYIPNIPNNVPHKIDKAICGRNFPNIIYSFTLTSERLKNYLSTLLQPFHYLNLEPIEVVGLQYSLNSQQVRQTEHNFLYLQILQQHEFPDPRSS